MTSSESRIIEKMKNYREQQKKTYTMNQGENDTIHQLVKEAENQNKFLLEYENEEESRFNSALSTLLAEDSWQLVTTRTGRYKVHFRKSLNYMDRISILGIVLEDIRERYYDLKANLQQSKREYSNRMRRKLKKKKKKKDATMVTTTTITTTTNQSKRSRERGS